MARRLITMGTWENKPIEWMVLKEDKGKSLLISRLAIMSLELSWKRRAGTWVDSSLRAYLNQDFFNQAFSEKEKKQIINSYLKEPNGTKDNVFLLSESEITALLPTDGDRRLGDGRCGSSRHFGFSYSCDECYKYCNGDGTCYYLRTPNSSSYMRAISPEGYITNCSGWRSIRPSMWIFEE